MTITEENKTASRLDEARHPLMSPSEQEMMIDMETDDDFDQTIRTCISPMRQGLSS
jgi:hypothetical protein